MKSYIPYFIICLMLLFACETGKQKSLEISLIENGLTPSLLIGGEPTWNILERMNKHKVPGVSMAVIFGNKLSWSKAYGITRNGMDNWVDTQTLFQAASISKPVTAVLTLLLVQEGLIDLDRNVNEYLKSWKVPENEYTSTEKVTVRRILSHSSGLSVGGFRGYAYEESVPTLLETLDGKSPSNSDPIRVISVPGERFDYSGGGYIVLQQLLEDVSGQIISELMDSWLFEPLQMNNSVFGDPYERFSSERIAYAHNYKEESFKGHRFTDHGSACCELWTTAEDLAKFTIFIQQSLKGEHQDKLPPDLAKLLHKPYNSESMALGFFTSTDENNTYFNHSGSNPPGFTCWLLAHASDGYGMILMTNSQTGGALYPEVLHAIAKGYNWSHFQPYTYNTFRDFITAVRNNHYNKTESDRPFSENKLNLIGYELLSMNKSKEAIEVLFLNTEFYPQSANCFDSLGDAYIELGDTLNGLRAYRQVIDLIEQDPVKYHGNRYLIDGYKKEFPELFQGL